MISTEQTNCARAQCPGFIYYLRKDHLWGQWGKPGKYFLARGPVWLGVLRAPMQVKTLLKASQCRLAYFWDTASYRLPLSRAFRQPTINEYLHITAITCIRTTFSCSERWTAGAIGPAAVKLLLPCALNISFANHTADHRMRISWILKVRRIHEFLRISKMSMNFKNKIRYREKLKIGWKSLMQTYYCNVIEENNIVTSANTVTC